MSEEDILHYLPNTLSLLQEVISQCQICELSNTRLNTVFGEGPTNAKLMIIAEAPGAKEDETGHPFIGESGKLLTKMIENAIEVKRESVYITNIVKCRPPNNRNPLENEIRSCIPFLEKQIEIIQPQIILCLGSISFHTLSNTTLPISKARGKLFKYNDITLIPSYHPSYLLRNPSAKKESYRDMLIVKEILNRI